MKKFTLLFFSLLLTGLFNLNYAQQQNLTETFIINGGEFSDKSEHVSVGLFNHDANEYSVVDSIYTQSTQDALVHEDELYVSAQDSLISYSLSSKSRIAGTEITGVNQLAVFQDLLIVTRQHPVETMSVKLLNKNTLEELQTIELSGEAGGVQIHMDSAYVAVPGAWGTEDGKLAVIDLENRELSREINFGADATGLKEVFLNNNIIYTVNTNFSNSSDNKLSVSTFDIFANEKETTVINGDYYGYYGNSVMVEDHIYIPVSSSIASYDINAGEIDFDFIKVTPAAVEYDAANEYLHITTSDFSTFGDYKAYDLSGKQVMDSVAVGVSPEAMAHNYTIHNQFAFSDADLWVGEGSKKALLVIDWNDGADSVSMAWGYRFDGEVTAEDMLKAVSETDAYLDIAMAGGYLNDIVYDGEEIFHEGLAGDPDYWSTWSRDNSSLWSMNEGIGTTLSDSTRFGCSYGFNPEATAPDTPVAAEQVVTGISEETAFKSKIYQANNQLRIESSVPLKDVALYDISGRILKSVNGGYNENITLNTGEMNPQVVIVRVTSAGNKRMSKKILLK